MFPLRGGITASRGAFDAPSSLGKVRRTRKKGFEERLLAHIFAVSVGGFSVMDNHLHLFFALRPEASDVWSDEEVVRRWGRLFPPRDKSRQTLPVSNDWVHSRLKDADWVEKTRTRLQSLSWFMKCLKEPLSRLANRQDQTRGAFFEQRFKSVGVLDDEAMLAIRAYIDLNSVAAGIVEVPEASPHTSVTTRVEHVKAQSRIGDLSCRAWQRGGLNASAGLEETIWLCPIEDRRRLDSSREGMVEGLSLGSYLLLVDYTGRLFREGKTAISAELAGILARLGTSAEGWQARLEKLRGGRLLGRFFAASRERLREVAARLGVHHLANLGGCPAR